MRNLIVTLSVMFAVLLPSVVTADAPYARVTCPSGSNWSNGWYDDLGLCVRYDEVEDCPEGFEGGYLVSYLGYDLDGFGCICQTGYTDSTGACVAVTGTDYTNCPETWGPVTGQKGVCQPNYVRWGVPATTASWTKSEHWIAGPNAVLQWNRWYGGPNIAGDFVLHEEWDFYLPCNAPLIGWAKDPADGYACQLPFQILDDVTAPDSTRSWWLFHWQP